MFPSQNNTHKHTDLGHLLPDFSLQNTCKFALQFVVELTALATGAALKHEGHSESVTLGVSHTLLS
jgi:hypothetical protein